MALGGCGQVAPLRPAPGQPLPVKPLTAERQPDAQDLLALPTQSRPERIDELNRRGAVRAPDRFDLPPPSDAGPAPAPVPPRSKPPESP